MEKDHPYYENITKVRIPPYRGIFRNKIFFFNTQTARQIFFAPPFKKMMEKSKYGRNFQFLIFPSFLHFLSSFSLFSFPLLKFENMRYGRWYNWRHLMKLDHGKSNNWNIDYCYFWNDTVTFLNDPVSFEMTRFLVKMTRFSLKWPGFLLKWPGFFLKWPGLFLKWPGFF